MFPDWPSIVVLTIEGPSGNIIYPVEINETFREYYEKLYSAECSPNLEFQTQFLDNINLPQIPEEDRINIDKKLTLKEISEAIDAMTAGKTAFP